MTLPDLRGLLALLADAGVAHVVVRTASPQHLVEIEQARGSTRDQADIEALRELGG